MEKLTKRIPYLISGFFIVVLLLTLFNVLGLSLIIPTTDPCQGNPVCVVDFHRLDALELLHVGSLLVLVALLSLQSLLHAISFIKK